MGTFTRVNPVLSLIRQHFSFLDLPCTSLTILSFFDYSYAPANKFNRGSISSDFDYQYSDIPMQEKIRIGNELGYTGGTLRATQN